MAGSALPDQYVRVGAINARYWAAGDGGSPVILIHGLGGSVENWVHNLETLAQGHRVYALDMVGFGRSDKPDAPYNLAYLAQFVTQFMDALRIDQASLVGNSLGGSVALKLAMQSPERARALVLVDSAGLGKEVALPLRLMSLPILGEVLGRPGRASANQMLKSIFFDPVFVTEEMIDVTIELASLPGAQKSFLGTLRSLADVRGAKSSFVDPILDGLAKIDRPALVVWGKQDRVVPIAHAHAAMQRLPHATLHEFDRCGHAPQIECAQAFNALVLDFLRNGSAGSGKN